MWQGARYENKLVWVIVVGALVVLAVAAIWLYQTNLVTFGLKHLNAAGCPGDESAVRPRNGTKFDKRCVMPANGDRNVPDCSKVPTISDYTTPDGYVGTCFRGQTQPWSD